MNRLVIPRRLFRDILGHITHGTEFAADCPVGINRWNGTSELLVAESDRYNRSRSLRVVLGDDFTPPRWLSHGCAGLLLVGRRQRRGQAFGYFATQPDRLEPVDELRLVGAGMHTIPLSGRTGASTPRQGPSDPDWQVRWSRTIGVLGGAWHRLVGLHFGQIGAGRTGSVLARLLMGVGVRRLTLVDRDVLEGSNLGESDDCLDRSSVGHKKVHALARALADRHPSAAVGAVSESVTHIASLEALKRTDFLLCCCDHDGARLAASCLAVLYCRPLLDIATGIPREAPGRMGISVRLTLPGRCLLCSGGLQVRQARGVLRSVAAEQDFYAHRQWQDERSGSLASLNHLAVALGMRMIEDLVAERVDDTLWLQVEYGERGRAVLSYPVIPTGSVPPHCPVCGTLTGLGDEGLSRIPAILQSTLAANAALQGPEPHP